MITVEFPRLKMALELQENTTVSEACRLAGVPLNAVCGGHGQCGKCKVLIEQDGSTEQVLGCTTMIAHGMRILVQREEAEMQFPDKTIKTAAKQLDEEQPLYGVCDFGTTSVVLSVYDGNENCLGTWSTLNQQHADGADVISRLQAAVSEEGAVRLQKEGAETINTLLDEAELSGGIRRGLIQSITISGNSAMQHLLLSFPVNKLLYAPYVAIHKESIFVRAEKLGIHIGAEGVVNYLPLVGSFVGADTTAAMLSEEMGSSKDIRLLIDLGTNGELVLGNDEKMLATSAAAGPAMEGAGVRFGMRGAEGAIQHMKIHEDVLSIDVIGSGAAKGICGSGLVDIVAELRRVGILNARGRMTDADGYIAKGGSLALAERLTEFEGGRAFRLTEISDVEAVYLTQDDVRAFQLAKGAISAATQMLIDAYGCQLDDVSEIIVAGAFGFYLDVDSACYIGLLPKVDKALIRMAGNAALRGTRLYAFSQGVREHTENMLENVEHIELANSPGFSRVFARCGQLD